MREILYSRFNNEKDNVPKPASAASFAQLAQELGEPNIRKDKSGPALSPARYGEGARRCNAQVESCAFLGFDFDDLDAESFLDLQQILRSVSSVIYTTFSNEAKAGVIRARALIELSRQVTPDEYRTLIGQVGSALGVKYDHLEDPSRIFYLPSCPESRAASFQHIVTAGQSLDVDAVLAAIEPDQQSETDTTALLRVPSAKRDKLKRTYALYQLAKAAQQLAELRYPLSGFHNEQHRIAYTVGGYVPQLLDFDEVVERLMDANFERSPTVEHAESKRAALEDALQRGMAAPLSAPRDPFQHDDTAYARMLSAHVERDLKVNVPSMRWMLWNGIAWDEAPDQRLILGATEAVREAFLERLRHLEKLVQAPTTPEHLRESYKAQASAYRRSKNRVSSRDGRRALAEICMAHPRMQVKADRVDANPLLLGTQTGTYDLERGMLRRPRRSDFVSKQTRVSYDVLARAPRWEQFVNEVCCGDQELVAYLQRVFGYCATGLTCEHALFFFLGSGCNGKSTLLNAVLNVFGDYAYNAPPSLLQDTRNEQHPTHIASLFGRRVAVIGELDHRLGWNEKMVKDATGGDRLSARRMREDFWNFEPTHKFIVAANGKPPLRGADKAMRRRIRLIRFDACFLGREDRGLQGKLKEEGSGILNWCLDGAREYLRGGLQTPEVVEREADKYCEEQDLVGRFIDTALERGEYESVLLNGQIKDMFRRWVEQNDDALDTSCRRFPFQRLEEAGYQRTKMNGNDGFRFVRFKSFESR